MTFAIADWSLLSASIGMSTEHFVYQAQGSAPHLLESDRGILEELACDFLQGGLAAGKIAASGRVRIGGIAVLPFAPQREQVEAHDG